MELKKGYFFTLDALLALFVLALALIAMSNIYTHSQPRSQLVYYSEDIISILAMTKVSELNNSMLLNLLDNGNITDLDNTILEQIGIYWVTNRTDLARALAENLSHGLIPERYGFSIVVGGDEVYGRQKARTSELVTHKSMITGIEKARPIKGSAVRIFLSTNVEGIRTQYLYLGGFVGQGNVSKFISTLPADAKIHRMTLELSSADNFSLYINSDKCGDFIVSATNLTADFWDISHCNGSIVPGGMNNFTIIYSGMYLDNAYIAGGFIRIDYFTDQVFDKDLSTERHYLPGIAGMANLYSSFFVPGTLHSMRAYLHFKSNYTTYMTIGNRVIFNLTGTGTDQSVTVDNDTLSSFPVLLDYSRLSNSTVPIRFASFNTTTETLVTQNNADVILITDLSGSMKCRIGHWDCPPNGNAIPACAQSDMEDSESRRLGVAACLAYDFNDIVMNVSSPGNRLWLVDFAENANAFYSNELSELTHDNIDQEIFDRYTSKSDSEIQGGTCIACAINQAYQIFDTYSDPSRRKYVIVMTDGIPTYCTGGYWAGFLNWRCDPDSTGTTRQWPAWWQATSCQGTQADCEVNDCLGPANNAINASARLYRDFNATVHAVGMGPMQTCTMANYTVAGIASAGNGSFVITENATELLEFYRTIAHMIVNSTSLSSQKLIVRGNLSPSVLYPDSYIELNFTPVIDPVVHGEFPVFYQSEDFRGCTENITIPKGIRIIDAKITSYSGPYWTDHLSVSNANGTFEVFNLSRYSHDYTKLGDPFIVSIPANFIRTGELNTFSLRIGDSPDNSTDCSLNNSLIYTALINVINSTLPYSSVLPNATGCNWTIELNTMVNISVSVPKTYAGSKHCHYTNASHDQSGHDTNDAFDVGMFTFLSFLDYDNDGRIFLNFEEEDLVVDARVIRDVPYLWGPTIAEVRVWQ